MASFYFVNFASSRRNVLFKNIDFPHLLVDN